MMARKMVSFLDYFPRRKNCCLFLDEPNRILENGLGVEEEYSQPAAHIAKKKGKRTFRFSGFVNFPRFRKN